MNGSNRLASKYLNAARLQSGVKDLRNVVLNSTIVPHWIGASNWFWYRRQTKEGVQFRLVNCEHKTNEEAFDHTKLATSLAKASGEDVDPEDLPLLRVRLTLDPVEVMFEAFGADWRFDSRESVCEKLEHSFADDTKLELTSPDGSMVAFLRDYNLWIRDLETGDERPLTQDGEKKYCYGGTPYSWGAPLNGEVQARWSPDSKTLFSLKLDNRQVGMTPVVYFAVRDGDPRPRVEEYPCAYPGDAHVEDQEIIAIDVATGNQTRADYGRIPVNRSAYGLFTDNLAWWGADSRLAYFVDLTRGDKKARVVEFDTETGNTRILIEETSDTYINLSPCEAIPATLLPLPDTNELIWFSERDGWAHLYLYDLETGHLKYPLTEGEFMVRELLHHDPDRREIWIQTAGRTAGGDPYYMDVCRVNLDNSQLTEIVSGDFEFSVIGSLDFRSSISLFVVTADPERLFYSTSGIASDANYFLATRSRVNEPPCTILFDRDGAKVLDLEDADVSGLPDDWRWPDPVKLVAADGSTDIYGAVFFPGGFDPDKKYPVIDCSIASAETACVPKGSFTNAPFGGIWYLNAAAIAQLGFIVVTIDGRGTALRNREFVDSTYGWLPDSNNVNDRIGAIKQLAERYPSMDLDRVGVIGLNGTPSAVYGMLQHPEFYKVGVSQCLQDTRLMPFFVGELYEGLERDGLNARYAENLVSRLSGPLLLMHGLLDRMDHSSATWRLVDALQRANKDFDMVIFPEDEGLPEYPAHIGTDYAFRRTWDYFVRHLQGAEPPKEYDMRGAYESHTNR